MRVSKAIALMSMTAVFAFLQSGTAAAQDFPSRNITLVVPYAAGGPVDAISRLVGAHMSKTLNQQIIIENVGSAGGTTGTARVARAAPDGYTMLIHNLGILTAPHFYKSLAYDTMNGFDHVGMINTGPLVVLSRKTLAIDTAPQLWDHIKKNADKLTVAHAGLGATTHLCGLLMAQSLGVNLNFVPYRGAGPAMNDLLGGQVDLLCDHSTTAVPQVLGNQVKAFAVTSPERLGVIPNVPTTKEAGVPDFSMAVWHAFYVPKGTPGPVIAKLNAAMQAAVGDQEIIERFKQVGSAPFPKADQTPEKHRAYFFAEIERWTKVLKAANISPE